MALLWIVHRSPQWRDALLVLAGPVDALAGDPVDTARFESAAAPRAVLLGVTSDFEAELEFANRFAPRLAPPSLWVLLVRERDRAEVRRLFDALPAVLVALSSDATRLRRELVAALAQRPALAALGARSRRDELARRFALWTADLDPGAFLAATDPARAALPLVVRGEAGTGRRLVARYLQQATSRDARDRFVAWRDGVEAIGAQAGGGVLGVCIEDADALDLATQIRLRDAIEDGSTAGFGAARIRWIATVGDDAREGGLDAGLARALAGHEIRLPPLRERPDAIDALVEDTGRRFASEALAHLHAHPWPGNLHELDAVLRRTLAATSRDPIRADDLRFDAATILDAEDVEPRAVHARPATPFATREAPATPAPRQPVPLEEPASEAAEGGEARSEPKASEVETLAVEPATSRAEGPTRREAAAAPSLLEPIHRLSAAVAHEVANPLVGIRTYTSLLPTHFEDPEFRDRFRERVEEDTRRIEAVIETLARLGGLEPPAREPVDATGLLGEILAQARAQIRERRLVVLEELDRERPLVLADAAQLRFALGLLVEGALAFLPPRGDLYVSTRHRVDRAHGAVLAIELRLRGAGDGLGFEAQSLAVAVADAVVRAHGGSFASRTGVDGEVWIGIELPAPGA